MRSGVEAEPAEGVTRCECLFEGVGQPRIRDVKVDESGTCDNRPFDETALDRFGGDLRRDLGGCLATHRRESHRSVRRVVAVRCVTWAFE